MFERSKYVLGGALVGAIAISSGIGGEDIDSNTTENGPREAGELVHNLGHTAIDFGGGVFEFLGGAFNGSDHDQQFNQGSINSNVTPEVTVEPELSRDGVVDPNSSDFIPEDQRG